MPAIWTFRCFFSERGVDEIRAWYCGQPPRVRGKFLSRLMTLSQLQPHEWGLPYFRWLHGECEGLGEIRFELARGQHRLLGYHDLFFFQAEDGIRDSSVTGVQTCALPISAIFIGNG